MNATETYVIPLIKTIKNSRLYRTERGYQGQLLIELNKLIENGIFPPGTILEQEYQKTKKYHHTTQRPDIIIHVPVEEEEGDRTENNFLVIALKLNGGLKDAIDDFRKLDEMFHNLNYPEGIYINVNGYPNCFLSNYEGPFHEICSKSGKF